MKTIQAQKPLTPSSLTKQHIKIADDQVQKAGVKSLFKSIHSYIAILPLILILSSGCGGVTVVYQDLFNTTPVGQTPGPPDIGTSIVAGDVKIANNPTNNGSAGNWLQLKRVAPLGPMANYEAKLQQTVNTKGGAVLVAYMPGNEPITMSVYFNVPDLAPDGITYLHVDLKKNGDIQINDSKIEGTYKFNQSVAFIVNFDFEASPATVSLLIRGGGKDVNITETIPNAIAGFGFGKIIVGTAFEGENAPQGRFFIDEVIATKKP